MVQKSANWVEIKSKDGKYRVHLLASLDGGVNFRANAVFTIFALHLTIVSRGEPLLTMI